MITTATIDNRRASGTFLKENVENLVGNFPQANRNLAELLGVRVSAYLYIQVYVESLQLSKDIEETNPTLAGHYKKVGLIT